MLSPIASNHRGLPWIGEAEDLRVTDGTNPIELRRLYEEHADFVRRVVIRLGGPGADVEDLVHDVFLVAFRRRDDFEQRSSITTWLYGIALRVVSQARRRGRLRRFFGLDEAPEPLHDVTPHRLFEHREASDKVYGILDKIGERKRTVFVLYELEGLSGEEIAEAVGCPLKTVWTRLHHARKEFAEHVQRATLRMERETGERVADGRRT